MDLGEELSEDCWGASPKQIHTSSACAHHALIQLNIVLKAHLTNVRLADIYPNTWCLPSV